MFDKWVLDASFTREDYLPCFCPVDGEDILTGFSMYTDRCPGELVGVIHSEGQEAVEKWIDEHQDWYNKYRTK